MEEETKQTNDNYRCCHVIKRPDFTGYGFHLHAEKGKAGQYIGKVDPNSPAEEAGLRQGDRIVEVNSVRIDHESHKEVVERIRALENEVKLLVIEMTLEEKLASPKILKPRKETTNNDEKKDTKSTASEKSQSPPNSPVSSVVDGAKLSKPPSPKTNGKVEHSKAENGGSIMAEKDDLSNNLSLSVAEMRAKLATKKKVDPKRESVDLRKKYEIVQLL